MDSGQDGTHHWHLQTEKIVAFLRASHPNWQSCSKVATVALGDPNLEFLVVSIAENDRKRFVVHLDKRIKLTPEEFERGSARIDQGQRGDSATPGGQILAAAARAVSLYAEQLHPYVCNLSGIGGGRLIGSRFLHEMILAEDDEDRRFVDDTPVTLRCDSGLTVHGYIAGISRSQPTVFAAFDQELLQSDLPGRLEIHRRKLWQDLSDTLGLLGSVPRSASLLFQASRERELKLDNGKSLALDLSNLSSPWSRLLWGPPGSGKTYCLGWLAAYLSRLKKAGRILILAPSNVAVDAATKEVVNAFESQWKSFVNDRRIVRFGYPRDEDILARPELLAPATLEDLSMAIHEIDQKLRKLRRERAPEAEIATASAELRQLAEKRKKEVTEHLRNAAVVITTIAAVCQAGSAIRDLGHWDTVIVDECSMLNGAMALFLGSLAQRRFLMAGDPRQLAPIFEWRSGSPPDAIKRWLACDPFDMIDFTSGEGRDRRVKDHDPRVARLVSQRRCHPSIWETVANLYPGVRPEVSVARLELLISLHPKPGSPVVLFDVGASDRTLDSDVDQRDSAELAAMYESSCRKVGKSWENPSTARIAIDLARDLRASAPEASVSIVAPYRAQVSLIRRWLDEEGQADLRGRRQATKPILAGTVHSFQGGQSDIVIFDLVDGYPRSGPGALLRGDSAMRLVNVALTRARGKLIVVINKKWIEKTTSRDHLGPLWDLVFASSTPHPVISVLPPRFTASADQAANHCSETESPIEELFLAELKARQDDLPPFRTQFRIVNTNNRIVSRADFAFVEQKLAVYCDGARFHLAKDQWQRDMKQRRELISLGWRFMVFSGREINRNVKAAVQEVVDCLKNR